MTIDELLQPILNTARPLNITDSPQSVPTWDSLAHINIISAIEDLTGTELSTEEVMNLTSVEAVVGICLARGFALESEH